MTALEFSTKIEHGAIKIPKKYGDTFENTYARVIVLTEKKSDDTLKGKFRAALEAMKNVKMFQNIEDPTSWQKQLRNEWD